MKTFEKLSDFKKVIKGAVRGAIKTGVFGQDGKFSFEVTKCECDCGEKTAYVTITSDDGYELKAGGIVCTRIFNKLTPELFDTVKTQFEKLKKVDSIEFVITD